jgi:hypothetical protein
MIALKIVELFLFGGSVQFEGSTQAILVRGTTLICMLDLIVASVKLVHSLLDCLPATFQAVE